MRTITCDCCNAKDEEGRGSVGEYNIAGTCLDLCDDCRKLLQIWRRGRIEFYAKKIDEESIRWVKGQAI